MNKKNKSSKKFTQRGIVTSSQTNAQDMLDYHFGGNGYIYHFGTYWAIYTV